MYARWRRQTSLLTLIILKLMAQRYRLVNASGRRRVRARAQAATAKVRRKASHAYVARRVAESVRQVAEAYPDQDDLKPETASSDASSCRPRRDRAAVVDRLDRKTTRRTGACLPTDLRPL